MNGDMTRSVVVHDRNVEWQSSPASQVSRKRFHLVGEPESGQVTSHVRYNAGARFPRHEHPDGEEILVLSGVFSDEAGDWPAGTYLLNPEGFAHAPFSEEGCELFVKLRQYPGSEHLALDVDQVAPEVHDGYRVRALFSDGIEDVCILEVNSVYASENTGGMEGFVLQRSLMVNGELLEQHDWFRLAAHEPADIKGNGSLYLKTGALSRLRSSE